MHAVPNALVKKKKGKVNHPEEYGIGFMGTKFPVALLFA